MLRTGTRLSSVSVEDPTPYCQCHGCKLCFIWAGHGKGCCQKRARSDRFLPLEQQRCTDCARLRDAAAQEAAGAGEGTREHLRDEVVRLMEEVQELRQRVAYLEGLMRMHCGYPLLGPQTQEE